MVGWDINGTIVFNDVICEQNYAVRDGGCFYGLGEGIFNNGTVVLDNMAENGGSICERKKRCLGYIVLLEQG